MTETAAKLTGRVARLVALFSVLTMALLLLLVPGLLLLHPRATDAVVERLLYLLAAAAITSTGIVVRRLARFRYVLRAIALESGSIEPQELEALGFEAGRLTRRWLVPFVAAEATFATSFRPPAVDLPTGASVALLGAIFTGAVSLLLYGVIRSVFLRAMELAPQETMREIVEGAERKGIAQARIARRLRTAVATPVALVALGSALVASAHVRRVAEESRETTARVVARAAFEYSPGVVREAGLDAAQDRMRALGFRSTSRAEPRPYDLARNDDGSATLTVPLDAGSAELRFQSSSVPVLGLRALVVTVLTVVVAGALGAALGRAHSLDLKLATDGIRLLGTEAVIRGGRMRVHPPRFQVVQDLEDAIEELADRFRVFARAQERSILAREAATRTRGLFFASVSHDLKSPLNAILGFSELVRMEPLTSGQAESLAVIHRRGRELLALIETILDAARVEAGQLSLMVERTKTSDLFGAAFQKAKDLVGDKPTEIVGEIGEGGSEIELDRIQMQRALSTLIAFGVRESRAPAVRVRALADGPEHVVISVDVPGRRSAARLDKLLLAAGQPGAGEHRGLALALSLARSIIELHGGTLTTADAGGTPVFLIRLPRSVATAIGSI